MLKALSDRYDSDWESHKFAQDIPYLVARLSSLIFLGPKICHDKEWINVSVNYTIDAFLAARALNMWPVILQPLAHVFHPRARAVRSHVRVARQIIQKELKHREMVRAGELEDPIAAERHSDALEWMQELAAGHPIDIAARQIGLSLAAIHTTSNLITNVIYDLAAYPEYVQPLRDEIKAVMEEDGELKKTSLTKMKLMDSVLKETQRVNPVSLGKQASGRRSYRQPRLTGCSRDSSIHSEGRPALRWQEDPQGSQHGGVDA